MRNVPYDASVHKKLLAITLVSLTFATLAGCGGGGGDAVTAESACTNKGEHQHTGDAPPGGTEWECYELIDGRLVWREWKEEGYPDQIETQKINVKAGGVQTDDLAGLECEARGDHTHTGDAYPQGTEWECYYNPDGSLAWQVFLDPKVDERPLRYHWSDGICEEREVEMKYALTPNVDDIELILPLGLLSRKHVTPVNHSYVQFKNTSVAANDIIAPADAHIVRVEGMPGDYGMVLELSCDLYVQYGHLDKLVGPIAELDGTQIGYGKGEPVMRVPVKAGEVIAKAGEIRTDWQMSDQRVRLTGLQPRNYVRHDFWKTHSVSAIDYAPQSLKAALMSKLMRTAEPRVGKIDYDVPGSASGVWFEKDTNFYLGKYGDEDMPYVKFGDSKGYWDTHMSIAPAGLDPKVTLLGKGMFSSQGGAVVAFRDDIDATQIKLGDAPRVFELVDFSLKAPDGSTWSLDSQTSSFVPSVTVVRGSATVGVIVLQVTSENTLKAEVRVGANVSKSAEFTNAAVEFER